MTARAINRALADGRSVTLRRHILYTMSTMDRPIRVTGARTRHGALEVRIAWTDRLVRWTRVEGLDRVSVTL